MKKRILFVVSSLDPSVGGIERVTRLLGNMFENEGITVFYSFFYIDSASVPNDKKFRFKENEETRELYQKFISFIEEKKINIIINQDQNGKNLVEVYRQLKSRYDIKIVNCMHNQPDFNKYWDLGVRYKLTEFVYKLRYGHYSAANMYINMYNVADVFVLLSKSFIPIAKKYYGLKDISKMKSIPNPIEQIDDSKIIPFDKKENVFLIVSRLFDHQKKISSALNIWHGFEKRNPNYELIIAGDGPDRETLINRSNELGLKRVTFVGHITNPSSLYNESKFFLMTSKYEGFGMTLVEAQRYGCIPFAFDSYKSLNDIIIDGFNGFIIPNNDEDYYRKKMLEVVSMVESSRIISKNSIKSVSRFNPNNILKEWLTII